MKKFRQEFEMTTDCKKVETMFNRFSQKNPEAWDVWGGMFEYMLENGKEHCEEEGWSLWLYIDEQFGTHYMAIVLTDERQKI
jgi:hypothetical protein